MDKDFIPDLGCSDRYILVCQSLLANKSFSYPVYVYVFSLSLRRYRKHHKANLYLYDIVILTM